MYGAVMNSRFLMRLLTSGEEDFERVSVLKECISSTSCIDQRYQRDVIKDATVRQVTLNVTDMDKINIVSSKSGGFYIVSNTLVVYICQIIPQSTSCYPQSCLCLT